jgi:hypothetical protein
MNYTNRNVSKAFLSVATTLVLLLAIVTLFPVKSFAAVTNMSASEYSGKYNSFISDPRWCNGRAWGNGKKPELSTWGSESCVAYVADYARYMYGTNTPWSYGQKYTSLNDIRSGDIVYIPNHAFVVLERNGNNLYTAEGNYGGKVRIQSIGYQIDGGCLYQVYNNGAGGRSKVSYLYGYHYVNIGAAEPQIEDVRITNIRASNVTDDDARIDADVSYSNCTLLRVGISLWENGNYVGNAYDDINHSKNPFQMWYEVKKDIAALKPDAGYTYQLWAVTNTQTIYSAIYTLREGKSVEVPVERIAPTRIDFSIKQESQVSLLITASVYPANADVSSIHWQNSNTSMSTLMEIDGQPFTTRLLMLDAGTTVVSASVNDGECSGSKTINVIISEDTKGDTKTNPPSNTGNSSSGNSSKDASSAGKETNNSSTGKNNTASPSGQTVTGNTKTKTVKDLPAISISKTARSKTKCTVSWKKLSKKNRKKISKIQIEYSTDKKFRKNVKTVTAKNTASSKTINKLKAGKTYYVRIRAYTKKAKTVHVSKWSKVKTIKRK